MMLVWMLCPLLLLLQIVSFYVCVLLDKLPRKKAIRHSMTSAETCYVMASTAWLHTC